MRGMGWIDVKNEGIGTAYISVYISFYLQFRKPWENYIYEKKRFVREPNAVPYAAFNLDSLVKK